MDELLKLIQFLETASPNKLATNKDVLTFAKALEEQQTVTQSLTQVAQTHDQQIKDLARIYASDHRGDLAGSVVWFMLVCMILGCLLVLAWQSWRQSKRIKVLEANAKGDESLVRLSSDDGRTLLNLTLGQMRDIVRITGKPAIPIVETASAVQVELQPK